MHTINQQEDVEIYQHDQGHFMVYGDLHVNCDLFIDSSISVVGSLFIGKYGSIDVKGDLLVTQDFNTHLDNHKAICVKAGRLIRNPNIRRFKNITEA